jgi:TRAP-type uncharacterized transport system substrate-binding protein
LDFVGVHPRIIEVQTFDEALHAFDEREIDVVFMVAGIPVDFLSSLKRRDIALIPVSAAKGFSRVRPAVFADIIPWGVYWGAIPKRDVATVSVGSILLVSPYLDKRLKNPDAVIETFTRGIFNNR